MDPSPFYALGRTRGPGTWDHPDKPTANGAVPGRREGPGSWIYAVSIGEISHSFAHDELIPLGCVLERVALYGSDAELEAAKELSGYSRLWREHQQ